MSRVELVQSLEQLIVAHDLYQQTDLGGNNDPDWADWYAGQLLDDPIVRRIGIPFERQQLAEWLESAFAAFALTDGQWVNYLADRLLSFSEAAGHGPQ